MVFEREDMIPQLYLDPQLEYGGAIRRRRRYGAWNYYKNVSCHCGGLFWAAAVFWLAMERRLLRFFSNERQNCKSF